jgi:hypothetical protein
MLSRFVLSIRQVHESTERIKSLYEPFGDQKYNLYAFLDPL